MSIFSKIPVRAPKHSPQNLSFSNKLTVEFGRLYPILCRKVVPGDRFVGNEQVFCQFAAMASKVYQEFKIQTQYFFVPSRILWKDFEDFLVGGSDGMQDYVHPYFDYKQIFKDTFVLHGTGTTADPYYYENVTTTASGVIMGPVNGSLFDYMNLPTVKRKQYIVSDVNDDYEDYMRIKSILASPDDMHFDALPFVALFKIYCDHYADENLQSTQIEQCEDLIETVPFGFGNNWTFYINLGSQIWQRNADTGYNNRVWHFFRNYHKDYFTGALPFTQKGAQVNLPFTGTGQVLTWGTGILNQPGYERTGVNPSGPHSDAPDNNFPYLYSESSTTSDDNVGIVRYVHFTNGLTAIEDLRTALEVQHWYEINARGGTRYNEQILSHFGVRTPDARLDRSQFLMSHTTNVTLGNVYTTSLNADGSQIPGEPVSVARAGGRSRNWKLRAREHGYVIAFVSVIPKQAYFKGVPAEYLELDKFDYYWPAFQHLGEEAVKNGEVYLGYNPSKEWGYNVRYARYRTAHNQIHGDFRDTLKFMTDSRDFQYSLVSTPNGQLADAPPLNSKFIGVIPAVNNLNRIFNYEMGDYDHVQLDIFMNIKPSRPMSYFGLPRLI